MNDDGCSVCYLVIARKQVTDGRLQWGITISPGPGLGHLREHEAFSFYSANQKPAKNKTEPINHLAALTRLKVEAFRISSSSGLGRRSMAFKLLTFYTDL